MKYLNWIVLLYIASSQFVIVFGQNPFLRPGSNKPRPPVISRPAPPPPPPKPQNTNIELRGFFKLKDEWYFSIFDKAKNKGVWLKKGESFQDGSVKIEGFNPETEVLKMEGGLTLSLKKSENKILQVPSGIPVPKPKPKTPANTNKVKPPTRINLQGNRTLTIPPRAKLPTPAK
jgi:hypothetical protein